MLYPLCQLVLSHLNDVKGDLNSIYLITLVANSINLITPVLLKLFLEPVNIVVFSTIFSTEMVQVLKSFFVEDKGYLIVYIDTIVADGLATQYSGFSTWVE